jgi:hypothetical protein
MSTALDSLHKRMADLEAWKTKIGGELVSGVARLHSFLNEANTVLEVARKELGALGITVPGVNAPPTPPASPSPPTEGEPQ